MGDFLRLEILRNSVLDYLVAFVVLLGGVLAIRLLGVAVLSRLRRWAERTKTTMDDFLAEQIAKSGFPLFYFGAFYLAVRGLDLNESLVRLIRVAGVVLITFFGIRFLIALAIYAMENYWMRKQDAEARKQSLRVFIPVIKVVLWGLGIFFLLDNLGFKISTVLAGLGVGGVAVALASKAVLGDLFSYFAILLDRPFELGDFIIVGDHLGTVKHVGIKTTRLQSLSGEELVFSNTDLTDSRVQNFKKMYRRRVVFRFGVTYDTTADRLLEVQGFLRSIIEGLEDTVFDRAHFFSFGDSGLVFEAVYYVIGSDYNKYMDIQQRINLEIKRALEARSIRFAFPTRTVHLAGTAPRGEGVGPERSHLRS